MQYEILTFLIEGENLTHNSICTNNIYYHRFNKISTTFRTGLQNTRNESDDK